jgi:hypothetical protein
MAAVVGVAVRVVAGGEDISQHVYGKKQSPVVKNGHNCSLNSGSTK